MARLGVNTWLPALSTDLPWIDHAKQLDRLWEAQNASEDPYQYFDQNGYADRIPAGATQWRSYTVAYLTDNDPWVLTWDDGAGGTEVGLSDFETNYVVSAVNSSHRREYTFTHPTFPAGTSFGFSIRITSIPSPSSYPKNIKLFRKSLESLLNAGQICNPHFITQISQWKRWRAMDYLSTNENPIVEWDHRTRQTDFSWIGVNIRKNYYCGNATRSGNAYTCASAPAANPAAWAHGQMVQFRMVSAPAFSTVTALSAANPLQVTTQAAHNLTTGMLVEFAPGSLATGTYKTNLGADAWALTVVDATKFTLDGVNSSAWGVYSGGGIVAQQMTVAAGLLPAKKCRALGTGTPNFNLYAAGNVFTSTYDSTLNALVIQQALYAGGQPFGIPWEVAVQMANECNIDLHLCVPHRATSDFVTQAATMVKTNYLPLPRVSTWERSNEVWNPSFGFSQTNWAIGIGLGLYATANGNIALNNWYGAKSYEMFVALEVVFAGQLNRINKAIATWTALALSPSSSWVIDRLTAPLAGLPVTPASMADEILIAPYIQPTTTGTANAEQVWKYKQGGASADEALDWLDDRFRDDGGSGAFTLAYLRDTLFPAIANIAEIYDVNVSWYEGMWGGIPSLNSLTASSWNGDALTATDVTNFFFGYYNDDRFAQAAVDVCDAFVNTSSRCLYPNQYAVCATWSSSGMWGFIRSNLFQTPTPTYDALVDWNAFRRRVRLTASA